MIRKSKVLGPILAAAVAISLISASAASAAPFKFKAEKAFSVLTGKQHAMLSDIFNFDYGSVSCPEATYVGEQKAAETTEFEVAVTYSGCTTLGGLVKVTIDFNGCKHRFKSGEIEGGKYEGSMDIVCPTGKVIAVTIPMCTITIPPQNGVKEVTYINVGAKDKRERTMDFALSSLKYEEHDEGACATDTELTENGEYAGFFLTSGEDAFGKQHGIWVE